MATVGLVPKVQTSLAPVHVTVTPVGIVNESPPRVRLVMHGTLVPHTAGPVPPHVVEVFQSPPVPEAVNAVPYASGASSSNAKISVSRFIMALWSRLSGRGRQRLRKDRW